MKLNVIDTKYILDYYKINNFINDFEDLCIKLDKEGSMTLVGPYGFGTDYSLLESLWQTFIYFM